MGGLEVSSPLEDLLDNPLKKLLEVSIVAFRKPSADSECQKAEEERVKYIIISKPSDQLSTQMHSDFSCFIFLMKALPHVGFLCVDKLLFALLAGMNYDF